MTRTSTTFALSAGLAMALAGVAQAQTLDTIIHGFDAHNVQIFTVDVLATVTATPTPYTYTYLATLKSINSSSPVNINSFDFNFDPTLPVRYDNVDTTPGYTEANLTPGSYAFGTSNGFTKVGNSATFVFTSPLPPTGTVGVTSNSAIGGGGIGNLGPGTAAVPEAGTFALLGLGLLPLALVARRRMVRSN